MKEIAEEMGCHRTTAYKKIHNNISDEEIKQRKGEIISKRDGRPVEQYSLQG
jgi:response regulator of citrate/malate metabolism